MAGPYCRFCDQRCFVYRILPDSSWSGMMATCVAGVAHDRDKLGYDHVTAVNPVLLTTLIDTIRGSAVLTHDQAKAALHAVLRIGLPPSPAVRESYATFLFLQLDLERSNDVRNPG